MPKDKKDKKGNPAAIAPPGAVTSSSTHGPQTPVAVPPGEAQLRDILSLSRDVPIGRVCSEAVTLIDGLRKQKAK